jgi:hypothetical protein
MGIQKVLRMVKRTGPGNNSKRLKDASPIFKEVVFNDDEENR